MKVKEKRSVALAKATAEANKIFGKMGIVLEEAVRKGPTELDVVEIARKSGLQIDKKTLVDLNVDLRIPVLPWVTWHMWFPWRPLWCWWWHNYHPPYHCCPWWWHGCHSHLQACTIIRMEGYQFVPSNVTVPRGCIIKFVNHDQNTEHNVMWENQAVPDYMSALIGTGEALWVVMPNQSTIINYHCHPHEAAGMAGTINVI